MMSLRTLAGAAVVLASTVLGAATGFAQTPAEFYQGKTVRLVVSAAPGGGADLYARAFAPYLARHLPGQPNVVIANMAGAGGLTAAAALQHNEPRDGTVIGMLQRNNLYLPLVSSQPIAFDPREVDWIGSLSKEIYALVAWHTAPVKTVDDLFTEPLIIGSTSFNNENRTFPAIINEYLGGHMEIVPGYAGNDEIALAMERGEVQGRAITVTSLFGGNDAAWLANGQINVIAQLGPERSPSLPDTPSIMDHVKDDEARALFDFMFQPLLAGRPFAVPQGIPDDRLAAIRQAFEDAANDPGFAADLARQSATVELLTGEEIEDILETLYTSPAETIEAVRSLLAPQ